MFLELAVKQGETFFRTRRITDGRRNILILCYVGVYQRR
jgi:hypothetical protein